MPLKIFFLALWVVCGGGGGGGGGGYFSVPEKYRRSSNRMVDTGLT